MSGTGVQITGCFRTFQASKVFAFFSLLLCPLPGEAGRTDIWDAVKACKLAFERGASSQGPGVPHDQSAPQGCLGWDRNSNVVFLKNRAGRANILTIPVDQLAGIEETGKTGSSGRNFFSLAWSHGVQADRLLAKTAGALPDHSRIALAVNSPRMRSQDQLHIHLACVGGEAARLITVFWWSTS